MEALRYPRVDATLKAPATVELTVQDQGTRIFQEATEEAAFGYAYTFVSGIAERLSRPIYVYVERPGESMTVLVHPNGYVETESITSSEVKKPLYKRAMCLIPVALVLMLGVAGGAWGITSYMAAQKSTSAVPTQDSTPENTTFPLTNTAENPKPQVSVDGNYITYLSNKTLRVISTQTGEEVGSTDLGNGDNLTIRPHRDGFAYITQDTYFTWNKDKKFTTRLPFNAKSQQMVTRQGNTVVLNRDNASKPSSVILLGDSVEKFLSPEEGASYISADGTHAYWATGHDGGTIVIADSAGKPKSSHKLTPPAEGAKLTAWVGSNVQGEIMTLWDIGGKSVLVFQPADSDEVIAKLPVDTVEGAKLDFSGATLLLGKQIIDCKRHTSYILEDAPEKFTQLPVGFESTGSSGTVSWIGPQEVRKNSQGEIIGINQDGKSMLLSADHNNITIMNKDGE